MDQGAHEEKEYTSEIQRGTVTFCSSDSSLLPWAFLAELTIACVS